MGMFKDIAIDRLNQKKRYQVFTRKLSEESNIAGPVCYEWIEAFASTSFMESVRKALALCEEGKEVKLYDPYMNEFLPVA